MMQRLSLRFSCKCYSQLNELRKGMVINKKRFNSSVAAESLGTVQPLNPSQGSIITSNGKYLLGTAFGLITGSGLAYNHWKLRPTKFGELDTSGQFLNGYGMTVHANGDVYEGDYIDGKREGKGVYTFKNGDVYEGEFKNNVREGTGICRYEDGSVYEGEWEDDLRTGVGIMRKPGGYIDHRKWNSNGEQYVANRGRRPEHTWTWLFILLGFWVNPLFFCVPGLKLVLILWLEPTSPKVVTED